MRNKNAKIPDPNKIFTYEGDKKHIIYKPEIQKDGTVKLIESGYEDIHELINSFRESTDMAFILNQLRLGNMSYLNPADPMFGDFTEMPTSLADAQQRLIDAEYAFDRLSPEIKQKFDNNFNIFIKSLGSEIWFKNMGVGFDANENEKEEVSDNAE